MNHIELHRKALDKFGRDRNIQKAAEEFAEASAALLKYLDEPTAKNLARVHEELADAHIMAWRMRFVFNVSETIMHDGPIDQWVEMKMIGLEEKIGRPV